MKKIYGVALLLSLYFPLISFAELPKNDQGQVVLSIAPMLKKVMPAVVNIAVHGSVDIPQDPFSRPHGKAGQRPQAAVPKQHKFASLGSGVIVDANAGYLVTNAHVVKDSKDVTATLSDGRRFAATIVGTDPATDIAVLHIKASGLHALNFADTEGLQVGDSVAAIGNPFGLTQTVTSGIISALHRSYLGIEGYENFIQTDASINPGNSGGALVNMQGKLIGINTAILATSGGNLGIGFAIPADMAKTVMLQLIKYGSVQRGLLGVVVQPLDPNLAQALGLGETQGAVVSNVALDSPAEKAGIKTGDLIKTIDNQKITDAFQVQNIVGLVRVGDSVKIQVLRNAKLINLTAIIVDNKAHKKSLTQNNPFLYGIAMKKIDEIVPPFGEVKGIGILGIQENSPAWSSHLRPGDVIVAANQEPVTSLSELITATKKNKERLLVNVLRGSGAIFLVIK